MAERDALGLTPHQRAEAAEREADEAVWRPEEVKTYRVAADPNAARIVDRDRFCPARLPCIGRTAVGIIVPIRANGAEIVDEVPATYCPQCKAYQVDQRETR